MQGETPLFCIVLAEQPHRAVFAELVDGLAWGLGELGHDVERATYPRPGARNLIVAPHLLLASDEHVKLEPGTIVYNGEPHCSPLFVRSLRLLGHRDVEVWDYSRRTTEFLLALGIPARTVPFALAPLPFQRSLRRPRDIDVCFIGSMSPRRARVLEDLARRPGLRVETLYGVYGAERDTWLSRSKVALNVHYWDEGGSEDLRLLLGCAHVAANVSEGAPDENYKRGWAQWSPYTELANTCEKLVHSGEWRDVATRGFASALLHDVTTILREALR